ncbi:MAG: TolC family protein, partial [bacterium]
MSAQGTLLSPEEAVRIALENNYDIRIAQGDADIAHLNNTKGNAGMLPNINLVVNENFTLSAFQQKLANGNEFVSSGAPFNAANAGVQLAWTVFDGRRMFIAKNRLEQTDALGQLNLKNSVQTTAAN